MSVSLERYELQQELLLDLYSTVGVQNYSEEEVDKSLMWLLSRNALLVWINRNWISRIAGKSLLSPMRNDRRQLHQDFEFAFCSRWRPRRYRCWLCDVQKEKLSQDKLGGLYSLTIQYVDATLDISIFAILPSLYAHPTLVDLSVTEPISLAPLACLLENSECCIKKFKIDVVGPVSQNQWGPRNPI
jgi:hypothetical protein